MDCLNVAIVLLQTLLPSRIDISLLKKHKYSNFLKLALTKRGGRTIALKQIKAWVLLNASCCFMTF